MKQPERVDADDPDRCLGMVAPGSQCRNLAADKSQYCVKCNPSLKDNRPDVVKKHWLREQFEKRVRIDIDPGDEIKLLRENLSSINALIAAQQGLVIDEGSLLVRSGPIAQLLSTAEKITHSLVKLEREADLLLGKPAVIRWGQQIVQAVSSRIEGKFEGWENMLIELANDIGDIIVEVTNKEDTDE